MKNPLSFLVRKQVYQKVEQIEGIEFKFRKNPLSKCIRILLKDTNEVLVTMPKRASFKCAKDFALKNLDEIKTIVNNREQKNYFLDGIEFRTKEEFRKYLRKKAKEFLPKRLEAIAQQFGYKYNKVALKFMKSRWGSCSFKNNINLNISLVTLENELIDYVLLHELVHTVEKNHGEAFWSRLLLNMPDARVRRRALKSRKVI